jgi:hypothetical protein
MLIEQSDIDLPLLFMLHNTTRVYKEVRNKYKGEE